MEGMETTTNAPASPSVTDAVAAGHVPESLAVHVAQLGLATLEKPMTITEAAEAAAEDGFLTAVVEVSLYALLEGRANEETGAFPAWWVKRCRAAGPWTSCRGSGAPPRSSRSRRAG